MSPCRLKRPTDPSRIAMASRKAALGEIEDALGITKQFCEALRLMALGSEANGAEEGLAFSVVIEKLSDQVLLVAAGLRAISTVKKPIQKSKGSADRNGRLR